MTEYYSVQVVFETVYLIGGFNLRFYFDIRHNAFEPLMHKTTRRLKRGCWGKGVAIRHLYILSGTNMDFRTGKAILVERGPPSLNSSME